MSLAPDDPRHGTSNGYHNLGCRCDACRRAWRIYCRERSHRNGVLPWDVYCRLVAGCSAPHGTETRYTSVGCRCDACRRASADARWRRRHADAEAIERQRAYDRAYKQRRRAAA